MSNNITDQINRLNTMSIHTEMLKEMLHLESRIRKFLSSEAYQSQCDPNDWHRMLNRHNENVDAIERILKGGAE